MQIFTDEEIAQKFFRTGNFAEGTRFWSLDQRCPRGDSRVFWEYFCPICATDEYSQQGLCSGVFQSRLCNLSLGKRSCRCSGKFQYNSEQQEYRLKIALKGTPQISFVRWDEEFCGSNTKVRLSCDQHGEWVTGLSNVLWTKTRCSGCAKYGFNKTLNASVYVILVGEGGKPKFTGYGITNNLKTRIQAHKRALNKLGYTILETFHVSVTGNDAISIESDLKLMWALNKQDIDGFRREATFPEHYEDVKTYIGDRHGCAT